MSTIWHPQPLDDKGGILIINSSKVEPGTVLQADICIIGGGAAGVALACEFAGSGTSVLLFEAGGASFKASIQKAYEGETVPR